MRPIPIAGTLVLSLALLAACADRTNPTAVFDRPLFAGVPADGNGNKVVFPVDITFPPDNPPVPWSCGTENQITLHVGGWVQIVRVFSQPSNRNVELDAVNLFFTFTNKDGATFEWREVGADRFYVDGDLLHAIIGRGGAVFGVIGLVVVNLTTGQVQFVAGNDVGNVLDLACAALT